MQANSLGEQCSWKLDSIIFSSLPRGLIVEERKLKGITMKKTNKKNTGAST